jgi:hypothetical protein
MSASEVLYWQEYFRQFPFRREQNDYIITLLAVQIADFKNANSKKPIHKAADYLPGYLYSKETKKQERQKSLAQQKAEALQWAAKYK